MRRVDKWFESLNVCICGIGRFVVVAGRGGYGGGWSKSDNEKLCD
jgi:hypothetical protein